MIQMMYRLPEVKKRLGLSRSSIYGHINEGLFPKPIKIGSRAVGWPSEEVDTIVRARVASYHDVQIRLLVIELENKRQGWEE
jgi:prophage regulatory protein